MQTNLRIQLKLLFSDERKLVYNRPVGRLVQLVRTPLLHRGGRGFSPSPPTEEPLGVGVLYFYLKTRLIATDTACQAVPYRVIDTWGTYSIVVIPTWFTFGLLSPPA